MPKTKKRKTKSCNRGYPCGGSCISRGFKCRKKLTGQADTYANWLKLQGDRLGDNFNREAGKRIGEQASKIVKDRLTAKQMLNDLRKLQNQGVLEGEQGLQKGDISMLKVSELEIEKQKGIVSRAEKMIREDIGILSDENIKMFQDSIARGKEKIAKASAQKILLSSAIKTREKIIKDLIKKIDQETPRNQIQPFGELSDFRKELNRRNLELNTLKKSLKQAQDKAEKQVNQIVPFKKKRNRDFSSETDLTDLFEEYLSIREKYLKVLAQIKAIAI